MKIFTENRIPKSREHQRHEKYIMSKKTTFNHTYQSLKFKFSYAAQKYKSIIIGLNYLKLTKKLRLLMGKILNE